MLLLLFCFSFHGGYVVDQEIMYPTKMQQKDNGNLAIIIKYLSDFLIFLNIENVYKTINQIN
jgi:hypothetical protein